ncbi:DNA-binding MarR family transcriptional regulator [Catenulispora sp. EB89]|uniref:MarR family winged helix-turn-helix transcriptional regulator n=1 Tax=Catenulispora sp. EB89 TaxID=3156257 RepID=UPI0035196560
MTSPPDRAEQLMAAWRAELPEILGPTTELTKRVLILAGRLDAATRAELPALGLTVAAYDVLLTLRRAGAPYRLRSNELTQDLLLSTGGTSNVINRLAADGLVHREPDPADGRSTLVRLTPEGVALAERAVRATSAAHEAVFAGLPPEVVKSATEALRAIPATPPAGAVAVQPAAARVRRVRN